MEAGFCPGCPLLATCWGELADAPAWPEIAEAGGAGGTSAFIEVGLVPAAVSAAAVSLGCQRRSMSLFHCL